MNVKSFADLDDIIIDNTAIEDDTYADDFEEDEREKSRNNAFVDFDRGSIQNHSDIPSRIVSTNPKTSDVKPYDYGIPYVDEDEIESVLSKDKDIVDASSVHPGDENRYSTNEAETATPPYGTPDNREDVCAVPITINSPTIEHINFPKHEPIIGTAAGPVGQKARRTSTFVARGNIGGFSRVSTVSASEFQRLKHQPIQREKLSCSKGHGDSELVTRAELARTVQELLSNAATRMNENQSKIKSVQRRAIAAPQLSQGLSGQQVELLDAHRPALGINEYDPDYNTAVTMVQECYDRNGFSFPLSSRSNLQEGKTNGITSNIFSLVNREEVLVKARPESPQWCANFASSADPNQYQQPSPHYDDDDYRSHDKLKSILTTKSSISRTQQHHSNQINGYMDEDESVVDYRNQLDEENESETLLRLGISRPALAVMAERVHSQFVFNMIQQCRTSASTATSVEELAMHTLLMDKISKTFASSGIRKLRGELIQAAVEASLHSTKHK